jgi:hypothetical protein
MVIKRKVLWILGLVVVLLCVLASTYVHAQVVPGPRGNPILDQKSYATPSSNYGSYGGTYNNQPIYRTPSYNQPNRGRQGHGYGQRYREDSYGGRNYRNYRDNRNRYNGGRGGYGYGQRYREDSYGGRNYRNYRDNRNRYNGGYGSYGGYGYGYSLYDPYVMPMRQPTCLCW